MTLAALASLSLAAAAWLLPRAIVMLVAMAATMLVFAVLDVRGPSIRQTRTATDSRHSPPQSPRCTPQSPLSPE